MINFKVNDQIQRMIDPVKHPHNVERIVDDLLAETETGILNGPVHVPIPRKPGTIRKDKMTNQANTNTPLPTDQPQEGGAWGTALAQLREWDPKWAETCVKMSTNPWTSGVLPRKTVELIGVALNAACTWPGTEKHL